MDVRLLGFGSIEVEGGAYEHDIVIDRGTVRRRRKKPSRRNTVTSLVTPRSRPTRSSRGADPG
jgi:hypothetical protein